MAIHDCPRSMWFIGSVYREKVFFSPSKVFGITTAFGQYKAQNVTQCVFRSRTPITFLVNCPLILLLA